MKCSVRLSNEQIAGKQVKIKRDCERIWQKLVPPENRKWKKRTY